MFRLIFSRTILQWQLIRKCSRIPNYCWLQNYAFSRSSPASAVGFVNNRLSFKEKESSQPDHEDPESVLEKAVYKKFLGDVHRIPTQNELKSVRNVFLSSRQVSPRILDSGVLDYCLQEKGFDFGQAYIRLLFDNSLLNPGSIRSAVVLCFSARIQSPDTFDLGLAEVVFQSVENLLRINSLFRPSLILMLCAVNRWFEALEYLSELGEKDRSLRKCLNALAHSAFEAGEETVGWRLLKRLKKVDNSLENFTQKSVIRFCHRKAKKEGAAQSLFSMSRFLRVLEILHVFPSLEVVDQIEKYFKMLGEIDSGIKFNIDRTTVSSKTGKCDNCRLTLKPVFIAQEEYGILENAILDKVIKGTDVYRNSSPVEVEKFLKFCRKPEKFDVVVDGLNVFYYGSSLSTAERLNRLAETVGFLKASGKFLNILVIARSHIAAKQTRYIESIMHRLRQMATLYLLNTYTADDGFTLYAVLNKGPRCWLLSNDRMGNELELLSGDLGAANILKRFLAKRQILHQGKIDRPIFSFPLKHEVIAQEEKGGWCWHIPFDDGSDRYSYQYPSDWLCIRRTDKVKSTVV